MSSWDDDVDDGRPVRPAMANVSGSTNASDVQELIEKCIAESQSAREGKFDTDKADRTAAMFLEAELKLALFIGEFELKAKDSKNEIERIEAEAYYQLKANTTGKLTEGALTQSIARQQDVIDAKRACAAAESDAKKWNLIFSILRDGHIFFRNIGKNRNI